MVVILPDKDLKITKALELDGFKKQELQIFVEFWYLGSFRSSQSQLKRKRETPPPTALELRVLAVSFLCLTGLRQQHQTCLVQNPILFTGEQHRLRGVC